MLEGESLKVQEGSPREVSLRGRRARGGVLRLPPGPQDTFQDYQEMFVQFGYVVLFSSAFPLAALCALVNNLIEIRSDALKLCTGLQRPFGQRVDSIGQWQVGARAPGTAGVRPRAPPETPLPPQKVMEAMGVLAIVVNCYLLGQCGQLQRLFPWLSPEAAIVSVVVLEVLGLVCGRGFWVEPVVGAWSMWVEPTPGLFSMGLVCGRGLWVGLVEGGQHGWSQS